MFNISRKNFSIFTFCILTLSCSNAVDKKTPKLPERASPNAYKSKMITVAYSNDINGYRVKAYWIPKQVRYSQIIGPATLEFESIKDSTIFFLANNSFGLERQRLNVTYTTPDSTEIKDIKSDSLKIKYLDNDLHNNKYLGGSTKEPFFFADVDFDDEKEIVLAQSNRAQRGRDKFEAYSLEDIEQPTLLTGVPFDDLDSGTKFDYLNKKIIVDNSNGACSSSEDIYKLQPKNDTYSTPKLALVRVIDHEYDSTGCYELVYNVSPKTGKRTLLSRTKLKD